MSSLGDAGNEVNRQESMPEQPFWFGKKRRPLALSWIFALIFFIGWIRSLTGPEFAFSILYIVPIVIGTWVAGLGWGVLAAVVSTLTWLVADLSMIERFSASWIPLVNQSLRLIVFLFVVIAVFRYRRLLETQEELAMVDSLTRVLNRRAFFQFATREVDRSRRYGHPFSVMVIDVDNFKGINDRYGHETGDILLTTVVETLRQGVRAIDIVSRFGGDEFVVLLVRAGEQSASTIAAKLRCRLMEKMQEKAWPVTFSIGLVTFLTPPSRIESIVGPADEQMYQVKHAGKDSIRHVVMEP